MGSVRRRYVIPGDTLAEGNVRAGYNVIRIGDRLVSTRVGMSEMIRDSVRVVPLAGSYLPRVEDVVIGVVANYSAFSWEVDMNSCFLGILPAQSVFGKDYSPAEQPLTSRFNIGDMLMAKIIAFDRTRDPLVSISGPGMGKIMKGEIVKIAPSRVPRLIGKKGSMTNIIESSTKCQLTVAQNGVVLLRGPDAGIEQAIKAIEVIEKEAHTADLSGRIQTLLQGRS
jgi:exosome complex component RRP4